MPPEERRLPFAELLVRGAGELVTGSEHELFARSLFHGVPPVGVAPCVYSEYQYSLYIYSTNSTKCLVKINLALFLMARLEAFVEPL
jgi:hypothetical protein